MKSYIKEAKVCLPQLDKKDANSFLTQATPRPLPLRRRGVTRGGVKQRPLKGGSARLRKVWCRVGTVGRGNKRKYRMEGWTENKKGATMTSYKRRGSSYYKIIYKVNEIWEKKISGKMKVQNENSKEQYTHKKKNQSRK